MSKKSKLSICILFLILCSLVIVFVYYKNRRITIELGIMSTSYWDVQVYNNDKFIDEAIRIYEKENPGVKIIYRSGTLKRDYSDWLMKKLLKDEMPDLFYILPEDFSLLSSVGALENLNDIWIKNPDLNKEDFYANGFKTGEYKENLFAVPLEVNPSLMFANTSILKKYDIEFPNHDWSWNDLFKICKEISEKKVVKNEAGVYGFDWKDIIYTNKGEIFYSNGKKAQLDSKKVAEAIQFAMNLKNIEPSSKLTEKDFKDGLVAFMPLKFSDYKAYKPYPYRLKKYITFDWECIKLPKGPNGKNSSELYSALFGISSGSENKSEAMKFLKFLINDDRIQKNILSYSFGIPIKKSIINSKYFDNELLKINGEVNQINTKMINEVIEESDVSVKFRKYNDALNIIDTEIYKILNTSKDVEQSLKELNKSINNFLIK